MAEKLHFELVSPEKLMFSQEADMVVVPGSEGDFGVLAQHASVVSTLRTGILEVMDADGGDVKILVVGGFAEVNPEGLTVLAEEATVLADVDRALMEAELKDLEEDIRDAKSDAERDAATKAADRIKGIFEVLDTIAA
jgi:F-type H+-transporting ATPase subunit epsilon